MAVAVSQRRGSVRDVGLCMGRTMTRLESAQRQLGERESALSLALAESAKAFKLRLRGNGSSHAYSTTVIEWSRARRLCDFAVERLAEIEAGK